MNEQMILSICKNKGWAYNTCTAYLVETGITPYQLAKVMGVNRANLSFWVHTQQLAGSVNFLFLTLRKLFFMQGIKVTDLY